MVKSTFSDFYSTLTYLYNKHIAVDKVFKSSRNKYDKPWITTGLAKSCKVKSIRFTKTTAAQNEDALIYYKVHGQYFLAVIFVRSIDSITSGLNLEE